MTEDTPRTGAARQLSTGSASVAAGLGVFGLATFVYLGVAGRDLGPGEGARIACKQPSMAASSFQAGHTISRRRALACTNDPIDHLEFVVGPTCPRRHGAVFRRPDTGVY